MNHAGVKSSIDSSRMFNEPYAEIPSGALGTWGCPGSPGGRVHLSPSPSICLTDSFVSLCLVCLRLRPWLRSCGCWGQGPLSALHLDFDFAWARGGSASLSIVGYTLSVRSVPRYQLRPLSVLARIWSPELTRAVRCGARLQLREGSVNSPVKQT